VPQKFNLKGKMKLKIIARIGVASAAAVLAVWGVTRISANRKGAEARILYGNVELRQASLSFNNSERIETVLVDAGDAVTKGQVLARLETGRIAPLLSQARAQAEAQAQVVLRLRNGSRPEEIALAKANADAAEIAAADAKKRYERLYVLRDSSGVSAQDLDSAKAAADEAAAQALASRKNYELVLAGPRAEDVAQAEATLGALQAQAALLEKQLADAELASPSDGIVRTRVMEPGEMASPLKTVLVLALTEPKWIRTYVGESRLGLLKPGMEVKVTSDSFPGEPVSGTVGTISSVAEFTPKTLQTPDLRTSLVYEVRIVVKDPENRLRLGMPVTIAF
jgi:HlyD family secretion protein